jgi:dTDP-4-dehydrorhamnose reductase
MRVVVTGAGGQLGAYAVESLARAGHEVLAWGHREPATVAGRPARPIELTDADATRRALDEARPEGVLHLAALASYDAVFRDPSRGELVNVGATHTLANWCARDGARLLMTSTDAVFDGERGWYREEDEARPVLAYGRTKLAAEGIVRGVPRGLVARLSLLYGPSRSGREAFFDRSLAALRSGEPRPYFADEYRTPLHLADAAEALARLLASEASGVVHIGGPERLSRFEMMRRAAAALGFDPGLVRENRRADVPSSEPRPADTSLDSGRLMSWLPGLRRRTVEAAVAEV